MTTEERRTIRKRPVPSAGVWTYFRYSWKAASTNSKPKPRNIPPISCSQSWRSVLRKSPKSILRFLRLAGPAVGFTATHVPRHPRRAPALAQKHVRPPPSHVRHLLDAQSPELRQ